MLQTHLLFSSKDNIQISSFGARVLTNANNRSIFGIAASGGVNVATNYRLKKEDITYIFEYAKVDSIIVDNEYLDLLSDFRSRNPGVPFIVDTDTDSTSGSLSGPFDEAVLEGLNWDNEHGGHGWGGLKAQADDEDSCIAIPFTSGTTARPKGVVYTHRGAYLAAVGNIVESGLNFHTGRCGYLWTLPMFHAMGWSKSVFKFKTRNVHGRRNDLIQLFGR